MTNSEVETNSRAGKSDAEAVQEWSDEDLGEASTKVWKKYVEDWAGEDFPIIWEGFRRKRNEARSRLEELQGKAEFGLEEWIRLLAEVTVDIYMVEKQIQFQTLLCRHWLGVVNKNVCRIPPPIPPDYSRFACGAGYLEGKLNEIIRLLGGSYYGAGDR